MNNIDSTTLSKDKIGAIFNELCSYEDEAAIHLKSFSRDIRNHLRGHGRALKRFDIDIEKLEISIRGTKHISSIKPHGGDENKLEVLYSESKNVVDELLQVAMHLSLIALRYDKRYTQGSNIKYKEVAYYAHKMLKRYCESTNGAFSRHNLTQQIEKRLREFDCDLDDTQRGSIDKIFDSVFPPQLEVSILRCVIRLVRKYIEREFQLREVKIAVCAKDTPPFTNYNTGPKAVLRPFAVGGGADIWHSSENYFTHADCKDVYKNKGLHIIRFLIAHELSHHICHAVVDDTRDNDDPSLECESTRLARLILEQRELLYVNGDKESPLFIEARKNWKNLIKDLHPNSDDDWHEFVFDD